MESRTGKVCNSNRLGGWKKFLRMRWISGKTSQHQVLQGEENRVLDRPTPISKYWRPAFCQSNSPSSRLEPSGNTRSSSHHRLATAKRHTQTQVNQTLRRCSPSRHCRSKVGRWSRGKTELDFAKYKLSRVSARSVGGKYRLSLGRSSVESLCSHWDVVYWNAYQGTWNWGLTAGVCQNRGRLNCAGFEFIVSPMCMFFNFRKASTRPPVLLVLETRKAVSSGMSSGSSARRLIFILPLEEVASISSVSEDDEEESVIKSPEEKVGIVRDLFERGNLRWVVCGRGDTRGFGVGISLGWDWIEVQEDAGTVPAWEVDGTVGSRLAFHDPRMTGGPNSSEKSVSGHNWQRYSNER